MRAGGTCQDTVWLPRTISVWFFLVAVRMVWWTSRLLAVIAEEKYQLSWLHG